MTGLTRALLALGLIGVTFAAVIAAAVISSDFSDAEAFWAVFVPFVGLSFIGTGLFAWWRRPENRFGALMTAAGFAWLVAGLRWVDSAWPYLIAQVVVGVFVVLVAHMLLAFPSGRLPGQRARQVVAAAYGVALLGPIPGLLFTDYDQVMDGNCGPCPSNPILMDANEGVADVLNGILGLVGVALVGAIA